MQENINTCLKRAYICSLTSFPGSSLSVFSLSLAPLKSPSETASRAGYLWNPLRAGDCQLQMKESEMEECSGRLYIHFIPCAPFAPPPPPPPAFSQRGVKRHPNTDLMDTLIWNILCNSVINTSLEEGISLYLDIVSYYPWVCSACPWPHWSLHQRLPAGRGTCGILWGRGTANCRWRECNGGMQWQTLHQISFHVPLFRPPPPPGL